MKVTRATWLTRLLPAIILFSSQLIIQEDSYAIDSSVSKSPAKVENITQSAARLELNPRFVGNDAYIVYLEFCGNEEYPEPWGYRLMMIDRGGHTLAPLTKSGVVDFTVLPTASEIKYLTVPAKNIKAWSEENFLTEITQWEVWQLNMRTHKHTLVETADNRPLKDGYALLGISGLPGAEQEAVINISPEGSRSLQVTRYASNGKDMIAFVTAGQVAFQTEEFKTHTHFNWQPQTLWLDENEIITLQFESQSNASLPQTEGLFSIIRLDLENGKSQTVFQSTQLNPFPRFQLHTEKAHLYFQQLGKAGRNELWRLNLETGQADMLYQTKGAIGESRPSFDGTSLVFTELIDGNFDLMRLDLVPNQTSSFAGTDNQ